MAGDSVTTPLTPAPADRPDPEPLPDDELDRLLELAEKATPGPWVAQSRDDGRSEPWYVDSHAYEDGPYPVVPPPGTAFRLTLKDAAYIAALDPATVRRLVAEVRRLRAVETAATALVAMQEENGCPTCGGTGVAWDWPDSVDLAAALRERRP